MQTGLNLTCVSAGVTKEENGENPETEVCIICLRDGYHKSSCVIIYYVFFFVVKYLFCSQMSSLESQLRRLQEDNRKLRTVLDQITRSYTQLQAQLFITLQKQKLHQVDLLHIDFRHLIIYLRLIDFLSLKSKI